MNMEQEKQATILIIDDDEVIRESCTKVLVREGYRVDSASDGPSGCKKARLIHPDLAIVDLKMPGTGRSGDFGRINPNRPYMAKVVITGYATVSIAIESLSMGHPIS